MAALRFGAQLAPEAFAGFLNAQRAGRYALLRLPADGDPMVRRVSDIRDRDQMFVDTLNEHYLSFYERMGLAYANWRQDSYEEQAALDKINRESMLKKILGGAAMVAGMAMSGSDSQGSAHRRRHRDARRVCAPSRPGPSSPRRRRCTRRRSKELATSADGEVAPLLVEVEGQQLKLTGSAEKQFTEWRELLRRVFAIETGIPGDPNAAGGGAGAALALNAGRA